MTFLSKFRLATGGHHEVQPLWMPATAVRNLILEPMLTWLSLGFGKKYGFEPDTDPYLFLNWISQKGHDFEAAWIKRYAPEAFRVTSNDYDVRHADEFRKTLMAMDANIPVLHKAPLWSAEMQTLGTPDLLFFSEHFYTLFPHLRPSEPEPPHFLVADVKFSGSMEAPEKKLDLRINAAQVRLYSAMVGLIQGFMPPRAFLLTRTFPDFPVAIEVNLSLKEPLDAELSALRDTYQHIQQNGATLLPWKCAETAPRIGNGRCEPWSGAKKQIIAMLPNRPLEMLPGVGPVKAAAMRAHGYAHLDQLLTMPEKDWNFCRIPGVGPKTDATLQAVLRAHRTGKHSPFPASAIPSPCHCEMFCDFETLSNCNVSCENDFPELTGCAMIFMCGIWIQEGGRFRYHQFVAPEESRHGERLLLDQFHSFLDNRGILMRAPEEAPGRVGVPECGTGRRPSAPRAQVRRLATGNGTNGCCNCPGTTCKQL
jgi:hypothetical protein